MAYFGKLEGSSGHRGLIGNQQASRYIRNQAAKST
jgi:hypothetical protein